MLDMPVKKRVLRLENLMAQLIRTVEETALQGQRTERSIERLSEESERQGQRTERSIERLSEESERQGQRMQRSVERLSEEMREFKTEMQDFKAEMRDFKDEMLVFKDEMRDFKDEMLVFKTESRKHWGELANKMGTMAEDLVAPSIERVLREVVGCDKDQVEYVAVRVRRRHPDTRQRREFDVVAVCGDYLLINETKSMLNADVIAAFARNALPQARDYFPEFAAKKVIGAVASLYVDHSLVRCAERLGLIVLGFGDDVMDVLNDPDFVPTAY